jgi:hypothetical protein
MKHEPIENDFPADACDHWLQNQKPPMPSAEFMKRCLATVEKPQKITAVSATGNWWQYAAAVAAALLLWINFSMSAVQSTDFGYHSRNYNVSTELNQRPDPEIQKIMPQCFPEETR